MYETFKNKVFPESLKAIEKLPVRTYSEIRSDLKTGDLVFCSGKYWISGVIRYFSNSLFSHVGIIYRDEKMDRVMILEAEIIYGVRFAPLSKYLKDYHGNHRPYKGKMILARLKQHLNEEELKQVISFGMDELTRPYDNWEIVRILMRVLFKKGRKERNRSYICSELVTSSLKNVKIVFKPNNTYISPDEIYKDPRIEFVERIL